MRNSYESESSDSESEEDEFPRFKETELTSDSEEDESDSEDKSDPEDCQTMLDPDVKTKLFSALKKLKTPSAFAYSAIGKLLPNPGLYLPDHGVLGLPLSTDDAQKIISQASQSPFGKGEETIIDTSVRKSWELDPKQFSLKNPEWKKTMEEIVDTVSTGLGLKNATGTVSAELYKLLLYESGAFFKPHKDTEKAPGMFATLVVCLPSPHEGGKLVMTLDDDERVFETSGSSKFSFSYAAWYADITHEVLPVTSGHRLMLTYNLIRSTNFVIPSYNLVREHVKQLSTLLEQYEAQLKKGDTKLPPILVHKLKHKYTRANLQLDSLKPQDLALVTTLSQLSAKLGFGIYLATLALEVQKVDVDDNDSDAEEFQSLENVVELDGELIVKSFNCPDGALVDPKPQDAKTREADKEKHEDWTGNEGRPATYWYYDTVVVLVPPSKQLDFIFGFDSSGTVIEPLCCKLLEEYSKDPAEKQNLEQLCERILKQRSSEYSWYYHQLSDSIPPFFQKALDTAFELDRVDLFDGACRRTDHKIIPNNAHMLGYWAAKNGFSTMSDRLMKGVRIVSSVAEKKKFLESVTESFEAAVQELGSTKTVDLKQWSNEAILTAVAALTKLTKADAVTLAQLCKTMAWSLFEPKVTPVIERAVTMVKIAFIDELILTPQELAKEQQSFIKMIIQKIWKIIFFYNDLSEKDVRHIIETTIKIFSPECVETFIIPAMLTAVDNVSKKCASELFISLVQMIIKNKLVGFRLADNAVPPSLHKRLIQALLTKFLIANVRREPNTPTDWSLPVRSCNCQDCAVVNRFLQDPVRETLDILCPKSRRVHLYGVFTRDSRDRDSETPTYNVATIHGSTPNIWRITKHRRGYQKNKSEWIKETEFATQTLLKLKNDEAVEGRLAAYLQPYYSIIMAANVTKLPDLKSLVTTPQLLEISENAAPNLPTNQTSHKREASKIDLPGDELSKRRKQEIHSSL